MFTWLAETIQYLKDASEYTPFNDVLAARTAPYLPQNAHVCDAGCGLGYLTLALAPLCKRVTAVDVSADALAVLRENIFKTGAKNIEVLERDVFCLPNSVRFDAMVFCFFGSIPDTLRSVRAHCRGKAVLFQKNWKTHRFSIKETPLEKFTFAMSCAELDALGIRYDCESFALEMGQPFRSLADAKTFFRLNNRDAAQDETALSAMERRLIATGSGEFPYYLPANRQVGMIVVDAAGLPDPI